jgi:hypothetical protein
MLLVWMQLLSDSPKPGPKVPQLPFNLPDPGPGPALTGSAESHGRVPILTL